MIASLLFLLIAPPGAQLAAAVPTAGDTLHHPWSVPASWDIRSQEVTFESRGVTLAGTLLSPSGVQNGRAVVLVQQAGHTTRDDPLHEQIARVFNSIGYSAFLYDRRGHGESDGDPGRPLFRTMAEDAVAAMRAIGETSEVHPERVGFWGLSQSAWLAMEAGAMSDPAFVISVASSLTTPGEQMEFSTYNQVLLHAGEEAAERALAARRIVTGDYFREEASYEAARAALAEIEDEPWFELTAMPVAEDLPTNPEASTWIHEMNYDPIPHFLSVEAPLLFILGGEDWVVPVARTLEVADRLNDRESVEIVVIPGASHIMRVGDDPREGLDLSGARLIANSDKFFAIMSSWLARLDL